MSRHSIKIKKIYEDEYDIDMTDILSSIQKGFVMPSQNIFNNTSLQSFIQMTSGIKSKYYQNTSPTSKLGGIPKYKTYPKIEDNKKIITTVDINNLNEIVFSHKVIYMNKKGFDFFNKNINNISVPDDLIINFEIKEERLSNNQNDTIYSFASKDFRKQTQSYYFNSNMPSLIVHSDGDKIRSLDICTSSDRITKEFSAIYHYSQLNIVVNVLYNPETNKIIPSAIVYDMNNNPLEVHCYYKNEYIPEELMNELKPNLLSEDFKAEGYFTKRDMEFLDMLMI